jgi:RNA polymerase sigma-70 factor, ECF subfamily
VSHTPPSPSPTCPADRLETFEQHRPLVFSIAYRMLGSVMDAEDMVQETFLRWQRAPESDIRSAKVYLSTIVTRLCIDHLRSSRVRREQYVGPWLPEPLVGEPGTSPEDEVAMADSLSTAFLVLLERLSARERAAFLLREVFDYEYAEVARTLGTSEANCRQMVARARKHVVDHRPRFPATREEHERLMNEFMHACTRGDMEGLVSLLAADAASYSDGGGKVHAARKPVYGPERVARFLVGVMRTAPAGFELRPAEVNGGPGLVGYLDGVPINVVTFEVDEGRIRNIYIVANPDKLTAAREVLLGPRPSRWTSS